jgi:hypothetical protein
MPHGSLAPKHFSMTWFSNLFHSLVSVLARTWFIVNIYRNLVLKSYNYH